MSLMSINKTQRELEKLTTTIEILKLNYKNNCEEYDREYNDIKDDLEKKLTNAETNEEYDELIKIERKYTEDLKSYAQVQNELIFVRHFFLVEDMIISIFKQFIYLMNDVESYKEYFINKSFFNNIEVSSLKIRELTENKIDLSSYSFWKYFILMKDIRNSISHGDILFKMKYKDIDFFNKKFSIFNNLEKTEFIVKDVELNKDDLMKYQYPILFHPTNSDDSEWLAQLSDNIEILEILNKKYLEFCKQIQKDYKNYFGNDDNILLFGMGRPTNNNESIYQEDYLLSFKSFEELYLKKRMQISGSRSFKNNELLSYKEFENHRIIQYDWSYFKMHYSTKDILEKEKDIYIFNATFEYNGYVIYVDLIKIEENSNEIIIYINEINNKLLEFQIYVLLKLEYNIKEINLIKKNNKNIDFKKIDFLEKNLSTENKKIKFIERINKNLKVIRFCINNYNKPIQEYKLK